MSDTATNPRSAALRTLRGFFAAWLLLVGVGTAFPGLRLWGVHLPAFLPSWGQIIFFIVATGVLILPSPASPRLASRVAQWSYRAIHRPLVGVALLGAFILLRVSYGFLGDGMLRGREAQLGIVHPTEVLSGYLDTGMYRLLHPTIGATGQDAVAAVSIFAGCLFIVVVWWFTPRVWNDPGDCRTARMLLLTSTLTGLFAGYIESYALPCAAIVGFLLAAESFRRRRRGFLPCLVLFIIAAGAHPLAMTLYPALLALSVSRVRGRRWRLPAVIGTALGAGAWGYWALRAGESARETPMGAILIPLLPKAPVNYGLVSPAHLADLANLLLLVSPGMLIAIPLLWRSRTDGNHRPGRLFWPLAAIPPLAIPLLVDPKLGMARDWDLLALGLVPLVVWAAVHLTDHRAGLPAGALARPVFAGIATLAMFVAINANTTTAMARFERLLELDTTRGGYGYEILATWYHEHGQPEDEIRQWRNALRLLEHRRYWTSLSAAYLRAGDAANAFIAARRGYFLDTAYAFSAYYVGATCEELSMIDTAMAYYGRAVRLAPRQLSMRYDLAMALFRAGRVPDAVAHADTLTRLAPDSLAYQNTLTAMLIGGNRFDQASSVIHAVLQRDPQNFQALVNRATLYSKTGRRDLSLAEIAALLRLGKLSPEHRALLSELDQRIRQSTSAPDSAR